MMGGGPAAWFVVHCCSPSLASSSLVPSSSIFVLRGANSFLRSAYGRIRGSRTLQPFTIVLFVRLPCLSEGLRFRLLCSRNSFGDSTCSDWSVSFISRWMAAYSSSMPVNSALTSRCLQITVLSVSASDTNPFHTAFFSFTTGEMWKCWPIVSRAFRISSNSSVRSGRLDTRSSWLLLNDVRVSSHRASHTVGPTISPAGIAPHGDWTTPQLQHQPLL
jgi:hypothetical protein